MRPAANVSNESPGPAGVFIYPSQTGRGVATLKVLV